MTVSASAEITQDTILVGIGASPGSPLPGATCSTVPGGRH